MRLSPQDRAHSSYNVATASRMDGGSFSTCLFVFAQKRIRRASLQQLRGCVWLKSQEWCSGT
eukprot:2457939-Pyramimonas_sp.AAC.1